MPKDPEPAIYVHDLNKAYPGVHALKGVSLEVKEGEFFGLLGPNGAGKSTLINILAGLVKKDSGEALVRGKDTVREYRATRRSLGVVPQEIVFDPFFTVDEALKIQSGYFGVRNNREWIEELLENLDLVDKRNTYLRRLSGGMKRRLLIAQALVHKPPIMVLDEPTAGVDVEQRHALWEFIRRLNREGHTILLTTHYLEEAEQLCDRIAIIDLGEVKALDTKKNLVSRSRRKTLVVTTREPVKKVPAGLKELVTEINGACMTLECQLNGCGFADVLAELSKAGIEVVDLETRQPKLEDVFIELTRKE